MSVFNICKTLNKECGGGKTVLLLWESSLVRAQMQNCSYDQCEEGVHSLLRAVTGAFPLRKWHLS